MSSTPITIYRAPSMIRRVPLCGLVALSLLAGCSDASWEPVASDVEAFDLSELQNVETYAPTDGVPKSFVDQRQSAVLRAVNGGTFFLVEDNLVASAAHLHPQYMYANVQLDPNGEQRTRYYIEPAESVEELHGPDGIPRDFLLMRLYFPEQNRWGALNLNPKAPIEGDTVVSIAHPGWDPNPLTEDEDHCSKSVDTGHVDFVNLTHDVKSIDAEDLSNGPGGSGGPLIAYPDGRVIGTHKGAGYVSLEVTAQASNYLDDAKGSGAIFNVNGTSKTKVSSLTNLSSTWRHIVPGRFDSDTLDDLFFYDGQNGVGRFYRVTSAGSLSPIGAAITGMRRNWSQVVPVQWDDSGTSELFFYDASTGRTELYRTNGTGGLTLISSSLLFPKDCRQLVAGDFFSGVTAELLLYCPVVWEEQVDGQDVLHDDSFAISYRRTTTGYKRVHTMEADGLNGYFSILVAGEFNAATTKQEIMAYDPVNGLISFFWVEELGGMPLIRENTLKPRRTSCNDANYCTPIFTQITPGDFTSNGGTELMFYDPGSSVIHDETGTPANQPAETLWYSVANGVLTLRGSSSEPHTLARAVAGKFTSSTRYQVMMYDRYRTCLSSPSSTCRN
jgi:hypothetical protein